MKRLFRKVLSLGLELKVLMIVIIPMILVGVISLTIIVTTLHETYMSERKVMVKAVVDTAYKVVENFYAEYKSGRFTEEEAKKLALNKISTLRYGSDAKDYFWINDYVPNMIMHPYNPQLNGKSLTKVQDPTGLYVFNEMVKATENTGNAYVNYMWQYKDNKDEIIQKISYVKRFDDWQWIIGSGIYIRDVNEKVSSVFWSILIGFSIFIAFIGILSVVLVRKFISRPVKEINSNLKEVTNQLNTSSDQLADSSNKLSSSSSQQAAATQECVASLEEMKSMISKTQGLSDESLKLVNEVSNYTKEGDKTMNDLVNSMHSIKESNALLQKMGAIIEDISAKTQVINDIVFKTQLLSFNASIEAARAGEHGRGFAVVAEEVSSLANMSGQAAEEIRQLLDGSERQIKEIIDTTESTVNSGEVVTRNASELFVKILTSIESVHGQIEEIVSASNEQNLGISQTSTAMTELDRATMENHSIAEKASDNAKFLDIMSRRMAKQIEHLSDIAFGNQKAG